MLHPFVPTIVLCSMCILLVSCHEWQKDVTVHGVHFEKVRKATSETIIGYTSHDVEVSGFLCKKGWIHFDSDKNLKLGALKKSIEYKGNTIPADTWIKPDAEQNIRVCAFPRDTLIQGQMCKGTGGSKGYQTSFYKSGKLRSFFISDDREIDGIPCKASGRAIITLHENGKLKVCTLSKNCTIENQPFRANQRVEFDEDGMLVSTE